MVQDGIKGYAIRKHYFCQKLVKTDGFELKYLFPAQPSPFTRPNGKCKICILNKESNYLKADFFVISSHLVLALERTKGRKHSTVKSIGFNRFMTSEGIETLILAFTSKTGQSVAYTRHRIF